MKRTNLKKTQIRVIKADLIDQGIIREVIINRSKKYEFIPGSPALNTKSFEELRNAKKLDLDCMIQYVDAAGSRMQFLCDYLGDASNYSFTNCDNTGMKKMTVTLTPEWTDKLQNFRESYFPELEVASINSNIVNGVAASYYGISNIGASIHRSKYENGGDFPDFLLKLVLKAFRKKYGQQIFDLVVYIPPTSSGNLVKNFATRLAGVLKFPISHNLQKKRQTPEQKIFENNYLKADNVKDAFTFAVPSEIAGKSVLLIDDIFDSGATMKEAGRLLTTFGAIKIAPIVIAKTVAGDLV